MVRTKIICTLGPASHNVTTVRKMMLAGMDVARLNFSHGSRSEHQSALDMVRTLNKKYRRHIRILQDLEGPRIRIGRLKKGRPIELKKRKELRLTQEDVPGEGHVIPFDYKGSLSGIKKGQLIYVDDGNIALKVKKVMKESIRTEVIVGGLLKERKGVNIPAARLRFSGMSIKDLTDIRFGIRNEVDYIAQSFVRNKNDMLLLRKLVKDEHPKCLVIAKIENREGIRNIDDIIGVSDGIMIARGDMGICVPIYEMPIIQKKLIKKCKKKEKFVITATQMMESMVEHPRPTRAEATDVANAIIDGTDFVMLSAETAAGRYPAETVTIMNQIIKFTEQSDFS